MVVEELEWHFGTGVCEFGRRFLRFSINFCVNHFIAHELDNGETISQRSAEKNDVSWQKFRDRCFFLAMQLQRRLRMSVVSIIPLALLFQRSAQQFGITQTALQATKKMEPFLKGLEANIDKAKSMQEDWPGKRKPTFDKEIQFKIVIEITE